MNFVNRLATLLAATLITHAAFAQTAPAPAADPPPTPFSVNVGIASSYIYRGLNQSDFKPASQIGADYAHSSGFYVGVWASSIRWIKDFGYGSGSAEIDVYAGFKGTAGDIG